MRVLRAKSKEKSNFPLMVQVKNTENWNSVHAFPADSQGECQATALAESLARKYSALPVRILHYTGGPMS